MEPQSPRSLGNTKPGLFFSIIALVDSLNLADVAFYLGWRVYKEQPPLDLYRNGIANPARERHSLRMAGWRSAGCNSNPFSLWY